MCNLHTIPESFCDAGHLSHWPGMGKAIPGVFCRAGQLTGTHASDMGVFATSPRPLQARLIRMPCCRPAA